MRPEVFVLDSCGAPNARDTIWEQEILSDCASVQLVHLDEEAGFSDYYDRAAAIIVWHNLELTAATIDRLSKVQVIVRNGVGFENVDIRAAGARGIPVCNVPDYGTEEVADHAIALCLALIRQLRQLFDDAAKARWSWQTAKRCRRIRGQVFGIVGCGRIGTATALRAKALGFEVRFYDPYVPSGYEKAIGVGRTASLPDLLAAGDVVSLHVPLSEETYHMIDERELRRMKPTAFLLNTCRGAVIRHAALEEALAQGWIAGAGLDVLEHEPMGVELFSRSQNCIITPHCAFYSQEAILDMRRGAAVIVREVLRNGHLLNVVNGVQATARV